MGAAASPGTLHQRWKRLLHNREHLLQSFMRLKDRISNTEPDACSLTFPRSSFLGALSEPHKLPQQSQVLPETYQQESTACKL